MDFHLKHFACALALAAFCAVSTTSAAAQTIGIDYAKMPVGTQAFYKHTNGKKWVDVYRGVKRGKHVVERFEGHRVSSGRPNQTRYCDQKGRLLSYRAFGDRAKPYKITYVPHYCYYTVGNCTHKERFSGSGYIDSGTAEKWVMKTKKIKTGYLTQWYKTREPDGGNVHVTELGKYNLRTIEAWGSSGQYNVQLVKLVDGK